jgi:hypothetical protein
VVHLHEYTVCIRAQGELMRGRYASMVLPKYGARAIVTVRTTRYICEASSCGGVAVQHLRPGLDRPAEVLADASLRK